MAEHAKVETVRDEKTPVSTEAVHAAVDLAMAHAVPAELGERSHLVRAVIAERIGAVAEHTARNEVTAARQDDDATWDEVAHAFGISRQDAEQRFRTRPLGLPL
jgi:hypothetical protein